MTDLVVADTTSNMPPTDAEIPSRYSRQILFAPIGAAGQALLSQAHVAIVGCGATGAAAAALLVRAGAGKLTIIDRDYVEESNLQRQMLFDEQDAREAAPKAEAARQKLMRMNSEVEIDAHIADLVPENIAELLSDAAVVLDATDNFETRYLINDFCVQMQRPWIYAAAVGSYAATMNILPGTSACLACIFPAPPDGIVETCDTAGILNSAVNLVASLQVTEALKMMVSDRSSLRQTLLSYDLWRNERTEISTASPRGDCAVCQRREFHSLDGSGRPHITLCGRNSVQIHEHHRLLDLVALRAKLEGQGQLRGNASLLQMERGALKLTVFADGRAIVQGTTDVGVARSVYARFVGI